MKKYFLPLVLPLIVSCASQVKPDNYSDGIWKISNYQGRIDQKSLAKLLPLNIKEYSVSLFKEEDYEIYEAKSERPIKFIKIIGLEKGKDIPQRIDIKFSPNYCIKLSELNYLYNWTEKGPAKRIPIHVLEMPPSAGTVRWEEVGTKFTKSKLLTKSSEQVTWVSVLKECATEVTIHRLFIYTENSNTKKMILIE